MRVLSTTLVCLVALVACAPAPPESAPPAPVPPESARLESVRVLQLNLCGSGIASCFTGRAVTEAADAVRAARPDVVTLNEVCDGDHVAIQRALTEALATGVAAEFRAARDGRTGGPYRCRDGRAYGIAVLARGTATATTEGVHPMQDPEDPEQRVWLCVDTTAAGGVCTTHLAYTDVRVTLAQCRHLFDRVVAGGRTPGGASPVIVGADLNLAAADPRLRTCLPPGSARVDDGGPQHVVAPPGTVVAATELVDLAEATDRPGLLVVLSSA